ncbi:MAG: hypothetical protein FVQ83_02440 [Chloroflexi bacterium]|nr:hypothetical protein [Chloroflexota bacterium]
MIILRYILEWKVKDIGLHLDIAENTVSVIIRRARKKLRAHWVDANAGENNAS